QPVVLVDIRPTHRFRSIRSSLQPMGKILEIVLEGLAVVPPRLSIDTGRGFLLPAEVGLAQCFRVVDVVQERGEPQLLILTGCLTYPLQRAERVFPARCPGRVLLGQVPFGQASSLPPLRSRLPGVVRELLRYSRSVRLPRSVHHRRTSLDFPMRPTATAALGVPGISRFPFEVLPYVHRVCDRAGLQCTSRYRCIGWGLPLSPTASASRSELLTRLNTRPAHSLVNASTPPSRAAPHDSGPMWVATSHSYDSFIHYTSPVYPAPRRTEMKNLIAYLLGVIVILQPTGPSVARAANRDKDEDRLKDCGTVLKEILDIPDDIPQGLLDKADCVVIYPSVLKAAFVVGGSYGRGAMTCRKGDNFKGSWGAPTMMALEGGSFGFQIGGQATDFVLLVMNEGGARGILSGKVKLGGDASVAAGPVGRNASAETD